MDGSIADATSLRMRHQLQRAYHPSGQQPDQSFFDELMKLPVAQTPIEDNPDFASEDPTEVDEQRPLTNKNQTEQSQAAVDDDKPEESQEQSASDRLVTACCYAPPAPTVPIEDAPPPAQEPPATTGTRSVPLPDAQPDLPVTGRREPVNQVPEQSEAAGPDEVQPPPVVRVQPEALEEAPALATPNGKPVTYYADQSGESAQKTPEALPATSALPKPSTKLKADPPRSAHTSVDKPENPIVAPEAPSGKPPVVEPIAQGESLPDQQPVIDNTSNLTQVGVTPVVSEEHSDTSEKSNAHEKWYETDNTDSRVEAAEAAAEQRERADEQSQSSDDASLLESQIGASPDSAGPSEQTPLPDLVQSAPALATVLAPPTMAAAAESWTLTATSSGIGGGSAIGGTSPSLATSTGNGSAARPSVSDGIDASHGDSDVRQLSQQERVRLVQRVARSFSRLGPEGGQVTLKLHPPQLGVLNVSIRIEGQSMSAKLQTQSSAARDVILENLPVLRERLAEQGIEVEKFQVEVATGNNDTSEGQLPNSSGGDTSGESRSETSSTGIDYRRLSRQSAGRPALERTASLRLSSSRTLERSLDIRA